MLNERRKHKRRTHHSRVVVRRHGEEVELTTTSISSHAVFIAGAIKPTVGERLVVRFDHPQDGLDPVRLTGEVVRLSEPGESGQSGFAMRWVTAHCNQGKSAMVGFLGVVIGVETKEMTVAPDGKHVRFDFPGEEEPAVAGPPGSEDAAMDVYETAVSDSSPLSSPVAAVPLEPSARIIRERGTSPRAVVFSRPATRPSAPTSLSSVEEAIGFEGEPERTEVEMPFAVLRPRSQRFDKRETSALRQAAKSSGDAGFSGSPESSFRFTGRSVDENGQMQVKGSGQFIEERTEIKSSPFIQLLEGEDGDAEVYMPRGGIHLDALSDPEAVPLMSRISVREVEDLRLIDLPATVAMGNRFWAARLKGIGEQAIVLGRIKHRGRFGDEVIVNVPVHFENAWQTLYIHGQIAQPMRGVNPDMGLYLRIASIDEHGHKDAFVELRKWVGAGSPA